MVKDINTFLKISSIFVLITSICLSEVAGEEGKREFPYELGRKDLFLTSLGYAFKIGSDEYINYRKHTLSHEYIANLDRGDINSVDRAATYNWDPKFSDLSDVFYKSMPIIAASMMVPSALKRDWLEATTIFVMYSEVFFLTQGITNFTKGAATRIRPYAYNSSLSVEDRYEIQNPTKSGAAVSFFSGHTSTVFSSAVFISKVYQDMYGKGIWSRLIWGTTITAASLTAYSRVKSGNHYPSDVLVGAVVGSAIGYLIPQIHKIEKNEKLDVAIGPNAVQVSLKF